MATADRTKIDGIRRKADPGSTPRTHPRRIGVVLPALGLLLLSAVAYHAWFLPGLITAGDFPYFTFASLKDGFALPTLWSSGTSTGAYNILGAPSFPIDVVQGALAEAHLGWPVSERVLWIYPALIVPCLSTYVLSYTLFRRRWAALLSALAIVMNSYAFLLFEGGQFGVAVAYGFLPLIVWAFMRGQRLHTLGSFTLTGLLLAIQAMYDIRSSYISLGIFLLYGLFWAARRMFRSGDRGILTALHYIGLTQTGVALLMLALVNLWWILPAIFVRVPALPVGYGDVAGVRALSYMHLSNALALFHPLWFVNDLRLFTINPLFFALPLLVYGLLIRRWHRASVLFLLTLALSSAFLVKGDNDPGGSVYDWLFTHLPGFSLYRDASKFYQPLTLAYALLLSVAFMECRRIIRGLMPARRHVGSFVAFAAFLLIAVFPAYPAFFHLAGGTLEATSVPTDYARFNAFIDRQSDFFRVLWVPARPRFGTFSSLHPALDATQLASCCVQGAAQQRYPWSWLRSSQANEVLRALSVRYIVASDEKEINLIGEVGATQWADTPSATAVSALHTFFPSLHESVIGHLHVFAAQAAHPLFFAATTTQSTVRSGCQIAGICLDTLRSVPQLRGTQPAAHAFVTAYSGQSGAWYNIRIHGDRRGAYLVLQQTYDPNWQAFLERDQSPVSFWRALLGLSTPLERHVVVDGYANGWLLHGTGNAHVVIVYRPLRFILLGLLLMAMVGLAGGTVLVRRWRRGEDRYRGHRISAT